MTELRPATVRFIAEFAALDAGMLDRSYATAARHYAKGGGRDAALKTRLAAAEEQMLEKRVRDALRPRAEELKQQRPGLLGSAVGGAQIVGRALQKAEKLTDEEFDGLVEPYRAAGLTIPPRSELL